MKIVSSTYFLRNLRNLDFFELDLGKSKKLVGKDEFRKLDEFVLKFRNLYNRRISLFGRIGNRIEFYEDVSMDKNEYVIFNEDDIYEMTFTQNDIQDLGNYILETLRKIDTLHQEEEEERTNNQLLSKENIGERDGWVATDDKNNGKKYMINQTLSKKDYREQLKEKFYNKK